MQKQRPEQGERAVSPAPAPGSEPEVGLWLMACSWLSASFYGSLGGFEDIPLFIFWEAPKFSL